MGGRISLGSESPPRPTAGESGMVAIAAKAGARRVAGVFVELDDVAVRIPKQLGSQISERDSSGHINAGHEELGSHRIQRSHAQRHVCVVRMFLGYVAQNTWVVVNRRWTERVDNDAASVREERDIG